MHPDPWPAPVAASPVDTTVFVPGSKSIANRALVLAAIAAGPSTVTGLPAGARDLELMTGALRALGADIETLAGGPAATVRPGWSTGDVAVDCGLAGTVMRFVPPLAGLRYGSATFDGDARARERPMGPMLAALRELGVPVDDRGEGRLPFTVIGNGRVPGGRVRVDASRSSQFVTALLLAGPRFDAGVLVHHVGDPLPSLPHVDMTCQLLAEHGVTVMADTADLRDATWAVPAAEVQPIDRVVEPDLSNAMPFAAMALLTGGRVTIPGIPADSVQPLALVAQLLEQLGATVRPAATELVVEGSGRIQGIDADLRELGELVPTVAVLCALAEGPSRLRGIGHIAGHETDRLAALATELTALGGSVTADADGLTITPRPLTRGRWRSYADHRMATAGAIVGLRVPGVLVEDVATTAKTFPGFPDQWAAALGSG